MLQIRNPPPPQQCIPIGISEHWKGGHRQREEGGEDVITEAIALFSCGEKSLKALRQRSNAI